MEKRLGVVPLLVQMPLGEAADFRGIVDVVTQEVVRCKQASLFPRACTYISGSTTAWLRLCALRLLNCGALVFHPYNQYVVAVPIHVRMRAADMG
jgi:hypothetical protein